MFTLLSSCRGQGCIPLWHRLTRSFLLLLCFVLSALPTLADSFDFSLDRFRFTCYDDGTATLTKWERDDDIKTVTIPASVSAEGKTYQVTAIGGRAFLFCSGLTSVTFPESLTTIGDYAFQYCSGLTSVTFPEGLTNIGEGAFWGCSGLTSVTFPASLKFIGGVCFAGTKLQRIELSSNNPHFKLVDGVLFTADQTALVCYPCGDNRQTYSIPEGTRVVAPDAFYNCSGLTSVTFPENLTSIGDWAFQGCSGLTSVTFPEGLTTIGDYAFDNCSGLTSVTFPESLTTIGDHAFDNCSGLTSVISKAQQAPQFGYTNYFSNATLHLPYGAEGYDQGYWAYFYNRKTFLDLSDQAEQFSANKEEGDVEVSYTRTFHNTAWQPLFVPFDIAVDAVADQYAVAIVEDEQQAGSVNFRTLEAGEILPANSIALIRAKQEGEQVMKINATTVHPFEAVEKTVGDYTFRGTREATTALQLPNRWIMAGGKLHPAQEGAKLNTFRWYLDVQGSAPTQGLALNIREGNHLTTIGRLNANAEGEAEIYDLAGRRLPQSHSRGQLRIVNGQKSF